MTLEIRETPIGGNLKDFLSVVETIYRDDPCYVRPLDFDMKERLSKKNPVFDHMDAVILTAHRDGRCVGRATAQVDRMHLDRYKDDAGFFGYLDTIDDESVARALLDRASDWVKARGMKRIRGPLSLNINEEMGCLVEGFDTPPMIMMPHHRAWQGGLIEKAGFAKLKDVFAWRYVPGDVPPRARRAWEDVKKLPEVNVRRLDVKNLERDVRVAMDIFNDAWSDNWGYIPMTERELAKTAADMKLLIVPELTLLAEIDGEPSAFVIALPNLNELIADLDGKLLPLGLAKLLWRLKVKGPQSARLVLLGIRRKFRMSKRYGGLSTFLYVEMNEAGKKLGIRSGELSWTLEDNAPVNLGIKFMGGKIYKRYRVYEKQL